MTLLVSYIAVRPGLSRSETNLSEGPLGTQLKPSSATELRWSSAADAPRKRYDAQSDAEG